MSFFKVENLNFRYHINSPLLKSINFELDKGKILAILGPSGSGKTSLFRCIAGFERIQSGSIIINNKSVTHLPVGSRSVGMVFQDLGLFPHLSVSKNISYGLDSNFKSLEFWLDTFRLTEIKNSLPHEISGGQKQRVALARTLANRPDLLLLDESFSQLDEELRRDLLVELKSLLQEIQLNAIAITHDLNDSCLFADEILILKDGEVQQIGPAESLYHHPINQFVAKFMGELNTISIKNKFSDSVETAFGRFSCSLNVKEQIYIRPSHILLGKGGLAGKIVKRGFNGVHYQYLITDINDTETLISYSHNNYSINSTINFNIDSKDLLLIT